MAGNSFTFSFKRLPKAATLAVFLIFLLELGSLGLLHIFKSCRMGEGDLFIAESIFRHLKLNGLAVNTPFDKRYNFQMYSSVKEMARHGPYDIIVFGSSVGETGWVEMLKLDYGFKICKSVLNAPADYPLANSIPLIADYTQINKNKKAILLWADLTERKTRDFKNLGDLEEGIRAYRNAIFDFHKLLRTPMTKLFYYLGYQFENIYNPLIKVINIGPRDELFYLPDLEGLYREVKFSHNEYLKLTWALKRIQEVAANNNCVLAMAAFPTKPQQYEWLINKSINSATVSMRVNLKTLQRAAEENNIPFLDLEAKLDPIARNIYLKENKLLWNRADSHMNQLGNRYTAQIIKSFIEGIKTHSSE
ncbi:MAG: hypothetical protein ABH882_04995 [Candidatus Omnitrophota bacterium]|nr:hypothetical protein [Candidatus Omnitrophota bacterium]MBU1928475.1 hypothetical protein [Candidatus Omnitrophota bacterium]MBU2035452.1 hypothetical protein [Candidatus Omnitrophota bacterium]MBU2221631.1 hypothetical protein [Candidatus Omnitrophota bacterium]MBU2258859.1 hypothetical protein [Candidatus Omnitrophota bacterium]